MTKEETAGIVAKVCEMLANDNYHWDEGYLQMLAHHAEARFKKDKARYFAYAPHREVSPQRRATEMYAG
jgi:hypothetical protein